MRVPILQMRAFACSRIYPVATNYPAGIATAPTNQRLRKGVATTRCADAQICKSADSQIHELFISKQTNMAVLHRIKAYLDDNALTKDNPDDYVARTAGERSLM